MQGKSDKAVDDTVAQNDEKTRIKKNNDIREIRTLKQLEKVNLDFDSPRLKQAMEILGVKEEECQKK